MNTEELKELIREEIQKEGFLGMFSNNKKSTNDAFDHNVERLKNLVSAKSFGNLQDARRALYTSNVGLRKQKIEKSLGKDAYDVISYIYTHGQNKKMKMEQIVKLIDGILLDASKRTDLR